MVIARVGVEEIQFGYGRETYLKSADLALEKLLTRATPISKACFSHGRMQRYLVTATICLTSISEHWSETSMEMLVYCSIRANKAAW
jgi:hypothetical protein